MERINVAELWGATDGEQRVALVERFLEAGDYKALKADYPLLFGEKTSLAPSPDDYREACDLMRDALTIFALRKEGGPIDIQDMMNCGIYPAESGWYADDVLALKSYELSYVHHVKSEVYSEWLARASAEMEARSVGRKGATMALRGNTLIYDTGDWGELDDAKAQDDCSQILRQLFNLHLADIATVCDAPSMEYKLVPYSGVSLLWLGLSEMLNASKRAFRCKACDKPVVAYAERRRKEFCCPACRKWASKHPGEKRGHWYYTRY